MTKRPLIRMGADVPRPSCHKDQVVGSTIPCNSFPDDETSSLAVHTGEEHENSLAGLISGEETVSKERPNTSMFARIIMQGPPDDQPVTQDQKMFELLNIYHDSREHEATCNRTITQQGRRQKELDSDHFQSLHALHRTLLRAYEEFICLSQDPSMSPNVRALPRKFSVLTRMGENMLSFLDFLEHDDVPVDHFLEFARLAYNTIIALNDKAPVFKDVWLGWLGNIAQRFITSSDDTDRQTWIEVSQEWYNKASDIEPYNGRLYYHMAAITPGNDLQKLCFYARSLVAWQQFPNARHAIVKNFSRRNLQTSSLDVNTDYIRAHTLQMQGARLELINQAQIAYEKGLDYHIRRVASDWTVQGAQVAIINVAGMLGYGMEGHSLRRVLLTKIQAMQGARPKMPRPKHAGEELDQLTAEPHFASAKKMVLETFRIVLCRMGDKNVLSHIHVILTFLNALAQNEEARHLIDDSPWRHLAAFLNTLIQAVKQGGDLRGAVDSTSVFPKGGTRLLPEDFMMRGLLWTNDYFPKGCFESELGNEVRYLEDDCTPQCRMVRVLRLALSLAKYRRWLIYIEDGFSVVEQT